MIESPFLTLDIIYSAKRRNQELFMHVTRSLRHIHSDEKVEQAANILEECVLIDETLNKMKEDYYEANTHKKDS